MSERGLDRCRLCQVATHRRGQVNPWQAALCPHCTLPLCEFHEEQHLEGLHWGSRTESPGRPRLMSSSETAKLLGITVRVLVTTRTPVAMRLPGGQRRYDKDKVLRHWRRRREDREHSRA